MSEFIKFCLGLTENDEIIKSLKNNIIIKIERAYNSSSFERYMDEDKFKKKDMFDKISGTILIYLENGDIIGFNIDDTKSSVVVWFDTHGEDMFRTEHYIHNFSAYLSSNDPVYSNEGEWDHIVGHKIKKISIVDYDDGRHRRNFKDSFQRAIVLETDDGDMVISDLPGRGSVLPLIRKSQIPKEILDNSKIIEL